MLRFSHHLERFTQVNARYRSIIISGFVFHVSFGFIACVFLASFGHSQIPNWRLYIFLRTLFWIHCVSNGDFHCTFQSRSFNIIFNPDYTQASLVTLLWELYTNSLIPFLPNVHKRPSLPWMTDCLVSISMPNDRDESMVNDFSKETLWCNPWINISSVPLEHLRNKISDTPAPYWSKECILTNLWKFLRHCKFKEARFSTFKCMSIKHGEYS